MAARRLDSLEERLAGFLSPAARDLLRRALAARSRGAPAPRGAYRAGVALTVVIPCCNDGRFILDAIASVDACHASFEVVVVDDGSDDPLTLDALEALRGLGYFVITRPNRGVAHARNTAIRAAHGRYILPLDADDRVRCEFLARGPEILDQHPDVGVVYADFEYFGDVAGVYRAGAFHVDRLATSNFLAVTSVFRREAWEACGGFAEDVPYRASWEDHDFWLSLAERGWGFHYLPEVMFAVRARKDSWSRSSRRPEELPFRWRYLVAKHPRLYQKPFPEGLVAALVAAGRERLAAQELNEKVFGLWRTVDWLHEEVRIRDEQIQRLHAEVRRRDAEIEALRARGTPGP